MSDAEAPELRPYEPEWLDGFRSLVVRTHEEFGFPFDPELDADLEAPTEFYNPLILLIDGSEVIGSVALRADSMGAELKRMYLSPEFRHQGHGRRLLEAAVQAACDQGHMRIRLDTSERQVDARRLYEAAGFERVREGSGPAGSRSIFYELALPPQNQP